MTALLCFRGILSYKGSTELEGEVIMSVLGVLSLVFRREEEEEMGLIAYLLILVTSLLNNHWSSSAIFSDSR